MKPNILLITTDQQRHDHLGVKGLRAVDTPHLDRLAMEGVHFDRAYCPSPICTPTRVSLLTGRYPSSHGAYSIGVTTDPFPSPTLPECLTQVGYATALFGKSHFVRLADESRQMGAKDGCDTEYFRRWTGPYLGFQEFRGGTGHANNNFVEQHYRIFLEDAGVDYRPWFPQLTSSYNHEQVGMWNIPTHYHNTHWVAGLASDYIERRATRDEPWFCWASFQDPHEPYVCPQPWFSRVRTDQMKLPKPYLPGEFDDRHEIYRRCHANDFGLFDDGQGVPCVYGRSFSESQQHAALQATLGMIAFLDERIGSILQTLEATGQAQNTVIIFTSDHGEMHGHHGLWGKGYTAYEDCQRVPLLVWAPSLFPSQGTIDALANLVDLPRTILNLAGAAPFQGLQGRDLTPILRGETDHVQDAVLVECRGVPQLNQHTMITARHKLVVYDRTDAGELYDLMVDPDQYRNLWNDPACVGLRATLLHRLARLHAENHGHVHPRGSFS